MMKTIFNKNKETAVIENILLKDQQSSSASEGL